MKRNRKVNFLSILILFTIFVTSCGNAQAEADKIATAVAMTVSVQETQKAQATPTPTTSSPQVEAGPTSTPETADISSTPTKAPTFSPPTAPPPIGSEIPCIRANYISETIPDGTIMQPGQTFWKTWTIQNNGSCTWDSSYKLVFDSGDLMDGLLEYQIPEVVPPGDQLDISIYLKAPSSNGNYRGNWRILSPWGGTFGVGEYDYPLWVTVNVNDSTKPHYTVTNVTYKIVREPAAGCATNVWYTVYATITTNGPTEVRYQWIQQDGNSMLDAKKLVFKEATSITISREWSFHIAATPGTKWMQIIITEPDYHEYDKATWIHDCGNK